MFDKVRKFFVNNDYIPLVFLMIVMDILFWFLDNFWGGMFLVTGIVFGSTEYISYKKTGKTISQHFAAFREEHKVFAWWIITAMMAFWFSLIVHLATTGR